MSWLFSRALVAEYSADICLGGEPSAPSSTTPTPQAFLWRDKTTAAWKRFPSGMTCEPLTEPRGEELLTSFRAGFLAKTYQQQERAPESTASEAASGPKWQGSLAKYDRVLRSWKTPQCWPEEEWESFSEAWPKCGMTRHGASSALAISGLRIKETECGLWLSTPTRLMPVESSDPGQRAQKLGRKIAKSGIEGSANWSQMALQLKLCPTATLCEFVMGWPIGWTDLRFSAMDKFRQWRLLHGKN